MAKVEIHSENGLPPWSVKIDGVERSQDVRNFQINTSGPRELATVTMEFMALDGLDVSFDKIVVNDRVVHICSCGQEHEG